MNDTTSAGSRFVIEPFTIAVPQAKLDAIRAKVAAADICYAPDDDLDWKYGTDARYLREFRDHWLDRYDWRVEEAWLNRFPQYRVMIDGIGIHFHHVRSSRPAGFPLLLTHGWPGSTLEFMDVIQPLVDQGFDIVVPSLPGYGFSSRPARPIGPRHVAGLWRKLMVDALGYSRFGAQGGDWGSAVTIWLGLDHPDVVSAIHLNVMAFAAMKKPDAEFIAWQQRIGAIMAQESAYMVLQQTRPQTIALALSDTPIGFAGWVLEKCRSWSDNGGDIEAVFSKDRLITNIMTYLVNDAIASSIWLYHGWVRETAMMGRVEVPTGFTSFPGEFLPPPPRQAAEESFNIQSWTASSVGGHFAAWEQPGIFCREVSAFFRRMPGGNGSIDGDGG